MKVLLVLAWCISCSGYLPGLVPPSVSFGSSRSLISRSGAFSSSKQAPFFPSLRMSDDSEVSVGAQEVTDGTADLRQLAGIKGEGPAQHGFSPFRAPPALSNTEK